MLFKSALLVLAVPAVFAKVQFVGVNIAGLDFGCEIDGTCPLSSAQVAPDAAAQVQHFNTDDGMNIFRYPVSWQYLVNNNIGGTMDSTHFGVYDKLMQSCIATGAYCAIDIHNFARVNGAIIGQGGPSDAQFADFWSQLATKYASNSKVIFGIMNEPHDVDINVWATTVQAAVTAIRNAGATSQMILLPGNNFASAGQFVSSGSAVALSTVKNPDGTTDNLIMDLHKYLDVDNSGTHSECTTDNIEDAFAIAAAWLRENGRLALVSETGAGSTSSCFTDFCAQNTFLNQNSDVFLGYVAWAAGAFSTSYILNLRPSQQNGKYIDVPLASSCVLAPWTAAGTSVITSSIAATALSAVQGSSVVEATTTPTPSASASTVTTPGAVTSTSRAVIASTSSLITKTASAAKETATRVSNSTVPVSTASPIPTLATVSLASGTEANMLAPVLLICGFLAAMYL